MNKKSHKRMSASDIATAFLSFILNLFFPPKCVICGELIADGGELCPDCLKLWDSARRQKCPVCQKTARACTCRPYSLFKTDEVGERCLLALAFYSGHNDKDITEKDIAVSRIVWSVKTSPHRASARFAARELAADILRHFAKNREDISEWTLTYPPRTSKRRRKYGFDQGRDIAKMLSKYTGIPVEKCFVKKGRQAHKKLNASERRKNAENAYILRRGISPSNKKYIIIDDVITTGATVSYCAELLKSHGAKAVFPVCAARTKRKKRSVRRPAKNPWFKFDTKA